MLKWRHHVKLHLSVFWDLELEAYSKIKNSGEQEKEPIIRRGGRIEKSIPRDHRLSSLDKPRDVKRWSSGRIFLSYPHAHDRFL